MSDRRGSPSSATRGAPVQVSLDARREGSARGPADLERREVGPGPSKGVHSSLMASSKVPPGAGQGAQHPDRRRRLHAAIDGWFESVKPSPRARRNSSPTKARARTKRGQDRSRAQGWTNDEDYLTSSLPARVAADGQCQGLVSGYTGPGGKTVLPGRAEAKLDLRQVIARHDLGRHRRQLKAPRSGATASKVSGTVRPNRRGQPTGCGCRDAEGRRHPLTINPRRAGSWPGVGHRATAQMAAGGGAGRGGGAHAPEQIAPDRQPRSQGRRFTSSRR